LSGFAASTRDDKCIEIYAENMSGQLENLGVDGMTNKIDLKEIGWYCVGWIHLAQDRV
jgi:hypothetical protein